jgi:uncharacterized protein YtpQ (UPF0354 family)
MQSRTGRAKHDRYILPIMRLSRAFVVVIMSIVASTVHAAVPTDDAGLTAFAAEAFAKDLPEAKVTIKGPLLLDLEMSSSEGPAEVRVTKTHLQVTLHNVADHCRRDPAACEREVTEFVANFVATMKEVSAPIQKAELRVVVRSAEYVDAARRQLAGRPNSEFVGRQFVGGLWALLVADRAHSIKSVSVQDVAKLGLSADAAMSLAKQNVAASLDPLSTAIRDLPPNGIGYINGNFYDSSRLLLHDVWKDLSKSMNGHLIVAAPANDVVIYAAASDPIALDALRTVVKAVAMKSARPLSATLFKWVPGGWEIVRR